MHCEKSILQVVRIASTSSRDNSKYPVVELVEGRGKNGRTRQRNKHLQEMDTVVQVISVLTGREERAPVRRGIIIADP